MKKITTISGSVRRCATAASTALTALLLVACTGDDEKAAPAVDEIPISVTSLANANTRATGTGHMHDIDTEGGTQQAFTTGRNIDLFLIESGDVEPSTDAWRYDGTTPSYLVADGRGLFAWYSDPARTQNITRYWSATGNSLSFYAWYPAGIVTSLKDDATITVPTAQGATDGDATCDLMVGTPRAGNPVKPTAQSVPLGFRHRLAKVVVNLKNATATSAVTTQLNNYAVSLGPDMLLEATVNPSSAVVTTNNAGATGTVTIKDAGLQAVSPADNSTVTPHYCVIPPQMLTGKTIKIGEVNYTIPQRYDRDIEASAGFVYTFNLSFSSSMSVREVIEIEPWQDTNVLVDMTDH